MIRDPCLEGRKRPRRRRGQMSETANGERRTTTAVARQRRDERRERPADGRDICLPFCSVAQLLNCPAVDDFVPHLKGYRGIEESRNSGMYGHDRWVVGRSLFRHSGRRSPAVVVC